MELTFDDFRKRAKDNTLSQWEKIGFPDSYRKGIEAEIFADIHLKLGLGDGQIQDILDIGCGCSELVNLFIEFSVAHQKTLTLVDSAEMLSNITADNKNNAVVKHAAGAFPEADLGDALYDAINVYSVIQYPFLEQSIFTFIHACINRLRSGGRLLIGDIPNFSARNRFLASDAGKSFLSNQGNQSNASVHFQHDDSERIDDFVIFSILGRYRSFGCETFLLPQPPGLPFYNRREDILIVKR